MSGAESEPEGWAWDWRAGGVVVVSGLAETPLGAVAEFVGGAIGGGVGRVAVVPVGGVTLPVDWGADGWGAPVVLEEATFTIASDASRALPSRALATAATMPMPWGALALATRSA